MRGSIRTLSLTARTRDTASVESSTSSAKYDPETVTNKEWEREMIAAGIQPIGSRRRRAALKTSANIPFEKLPYQCFQEARSILKADREEKIQQIENERARIARLVETSGTTVAGGEAGKQRRLRDMRAHLEKLKILADINDPLIKKRFEDGQGMSGPGKVIARANRF
jgi:large subunit ribosomal protein L35